MKLQLTSRSICRLLFGIPLLAAVPACDNSEQVPPSESSTNAEWGSAAEAQIIAPPPPHCNGGFHDVCVFPVTGGRACRCVQNPTMDQGAPTPSYLLVNITYAPPGNLSEVDYSQSTYTGSNVQIQSQFSVGVETMEFGQSQKFKAGIVNQNQHSVQFTSTVGTAVTGPPHGDAASHDQDVFYVWTNPWIQRTTYFDGTPPNITITSNGTPNIESVTAAELEGLVPIPSYKVVSTYPEDAKMAILQRNPFFAAAGLDLTLARFQYKTSINLFGPDNPGDPFTAQTFSLAHDESDSTSVGWTLDIELDVGASFIGNGAKVDLEFQYQKMMTDILGHEDDAALKLSSSTTCLHVGYDVYLDTAFNTFMFIPKGTLAGSSSASGYDCCNSPHSVCDAGPPLDSSCGTNNCLQTVCGEDPYCCGTQWDNICVAEAQDCSPQACGM